VTRRGSAMRGNRPVIEILNRHKERRVGWQVAIGESGTGYARHA